MDFEARGRLLDETLEAVRGAFADAYVSHSGPAFNYTDVGVGPRAGAGAAHLGGRQRPGRVAPGRALSATATSRWATRWASTARSSTPCRPRLTAEGRAGARFDVGFMPPWCYLLADTTPEGLPPVMACGAEPVAASIRAGREAGANTFHLKFRARTLAEYLEQFDAFAESVVPLVNEA